MTDNIDKDGFRANVGIVICDQRGRLFWARRIGQNAWQFPQGGIDPQESPVQAMYRELHEEVGLEEGDVEMLGQTQNWLRYRLPQRYLRKGKQSRCIGQKQKWFLLRLTAPESSIQFDHGDKPEFDGWRWVNYWYPVGQVIEFKRGVYRRALKELSRAHQRLEKQGLEKQSLPEGSANRA